MANPQECNDENFDRFNKPKNTNESMNPIHGYLSLDFYVEVKNLIKKYAKSIRKHKSSPYCTDEQKNTLGDFIIKKCYTCFEKYHKCGIITPAVSCIIVLYKFINKNTIGEKIYNKWKLFPYKYIAKMTDRCNGIPAPEDSEELHINASHIMCNINDLKLHNRKYIKMAIAILNTKIPTAIGHRKMKNVNSYIRCYDEYIDSNINT